ncbi:hypothetical protein [Acinetobacter baumannii]|uniref:hypothetical protein n=1 Tax=Acinetobacter baumannii TaxID=470 RepID=UPI0025A08AD7|nr:hypothetical protein [Acinetobacter baumannii]
MRRRIDYGFLWVLIGVFMIVVGIGGTLINAKMVCEKQEVFWIKGTQYSCSIFK